MKYFRLLLSISSIALTACNRSSPTAATSPTSVVATTSITATPTDTQKPIAVPAATLTTRASIIPTPTVSPAQNAKVATVLPLPTPSLAPSLPTQIGDYQVVDEFKQPQFMAESHKILKVTSLPNTKVNFNPVDLLGVLISTRKYFRNRFDSDVDLHREGILGTQGVTVPDILKTLDFMIVSLQQDLKAKRAIRLQDPKFLNTNFRTIEWQAFNPKVTDQKRLRLTKYAVFTHPGSRTPTKEFNVGLYALKPGSDLDRVRLKYTKQDVLKNIYEPNGSEFGAVEPLAYLDRLGLESALMEGTVLIKFTDGTSAFFNVDRHNNIPFIKGLKPTAQQRYWYFKPVTTIKGYGQTIDTKISIKPGVTFAGDVLNIGLGRIVITQSNISDQPQLQMGIIADTGGAFLPNLHQLDFLAGVFNTQTEFETYAQKLPEYTKAYILIKR